MLNNFYKIKKTNQYHTKQHQTNNQKTITKKPIIQNRKTALKKFFKQQTK